MTEPKVLRFRPSTDSYMYTKPFGPYVYYDDYARLAARVKRDEVVMETEREARQASEDRLKARVEELLDARQADCENIQRCVAENKRLREALEDIANCKAEGYCPICPNLARLSLMPLLKEKP